MIEFPHVAGKTAEKVQVFTSSGDHCITVQFKDKTALNFVIEPGFTIYSDYDDRTAAEIRVVKRYPPISSIGFTQKKGK